MRAACAIPPVAAYERDSAVVPDISLSVTVSEAYRMAARLITHLGVHEASTISSMSTSSMSSTPSVAGRGSSRGSSSSSDDVSIVSVYDHSKQAAVRCTRSAVIASLRNWLAARNTAWGVLYYITGGRGVATTLVPMDPEIASSSSSMAAAAMTATRPGHRDVEEVQRLRRRLQRNQSRRSGSGGVGDIHGDDADNDSDLDNYDDADDDEGDVDEYGNPKKGDDDVDVDDIPSGLIRSYLPFASKWSSIGLGVWTPRPVQKIAEEMEVFIAAADTHMIEMLIGLGEHDAAVALSLSSVRQSQRQSGMHHSTAVALALERLADVYSAAGRLQEARSSYYKALEIHRVVSGPTCKAAASVKAAIEAINAHIAAQTSGTGFSGPGASAAANAAEISSRVDNGPHQPKGVRNPSIQLPQSSLSSSSSSSSASSSSTSARAPMPRRSRSRSAVRQQPGDGHVDDLDKPASSPSSTSTSMSSGSGHGAGAGTNASPGRSRPRSVSATRPRPSSSPASKHTSHGSSSGTPGSSSSSSSSSSNNNNVDDPPVTYRGDDLPRPPWRSTQARPVSARRNRPLADKPSLEPPNSSSHQGRRTQPREKQQPQQQRQQQRGAETASASAGGLGGGSDVGSSGPTRAPTSASRVRPMSASTSSTSLSSSASVKLKRLPSKGAKKEPTVATSTHDKSRSGLNASIPQQQVPLSSAASSASAHVSSSTSSSSSPSSSAVASSPQEMMFSTPSANEPVNDKEASLTNPSKNVGAGRRSSNGGSSSSNGRRASLDVSPQPHAGATVTPNSNAHITAHSSSSTDSVNYGVIASASSSSNTPQVAATDAEENPFEGDYSVSANPPSFLSGLEEHTSLPPVSLEGFDGLEAAINDAGGVDIGNAAGMLAAATNAVIDANRAITAPVAGPAPALAPPADIDAEDGLVPHDQMLTTSHFAPNPTSLSSSSASTTQFTTLPDTSSDRLPTTSSSLSSSSSSSLVPPRAPTALLHDPIVSESPKLSHRSSIVKTSIHPSAVSHGEKRRSVTGATAADTGAGAGAGTRDGMAKRGGVSAYATDSAFGLDLNRPPQPLAVSHTNVTPHGNRSAGGDGDHGEVGEDVLIHESFNGSIPLAESTALWGEAHVSQSTSATAGRRLSSDTLNDTTPSISTTTTLHEALQDEVSYAGQQQLEQRQQEQDKKNDNAGGGGTEPPATWNDDEDPFVVVEE